MGDSFIRLKRSKATALAATAFALFAGAGSAHAQTDFEVLGKSGGVSYSRESLYVPPSGEAATSVRCPRENQFVFAGGVELFGGPEASYITTQSSQVNFGWTSRAWDGFGLEAATGDAYSLCSKFELGEFFSYSADRGVPPGPATETETVKCEKGTVLGGGGYFAGSAVDSWYLNSSYPKGNGWEWVGYHYNGTGSSEIIAEVSCVKGRGMAIAEKAEKTNDEHVKLKVFCKKGVVTGGGGSASKNASNAHLVKTFPIDGKDKRKVPDDGWAIEYENDGIVKQTFSVYAVCR